MAANNRSAEKKQEGTSAPAKKDAKEIKTDYPLSEKDEVKQAEDKTRSANKRS